MLMKSYLFKLSLSLLLLIVAGFSYAQTADDIQFEKSKQKFEKCDEGKLVILEYKFSYSGKIDLNILPPKVDCSCTEVVLPKEIIKPNSTNTIKIKFDTKDKIGYQEREIVIQFVSGVMDSKPIEKKILFKGIVRASKATKEAYKNSKQH